MFKIFIKNVILKFPSLSKQLVALNDANVFVDADVSIVVNINVSVVVDINVSVNVRRKC